MLWPAIGYQSQNLWPFKFAWSIHAQLSGFSIYFGTQSDIRFKRLQFEFARRFLVQFWESRYGISRNPTSESRLIAIWICSKLPCWISSVAVYVGSQSNIHVKSYSGLNMLQLLCSILSVSIFESKVMAVWIFLKLSSFISSVSYPNFARGLLLDVMQPLIDHFEILGILCFTICEVPRHAANQKEAGLRDPWNSVMWRKPTGGVFTQSVSFRNFVES